MNSLYLTECLSLVDITNTGEVSPSSTIARNQMRNWETLVQVLGLRAQIMHISSPVKEERDIDGLGFGDDFVGKHAVWTFRFGIEFEAIYDSQDKKYGTLELDCTNVPIIIGLTETANIITPTLVVDGKQKNITFKSFEL